VMERVRLFLAECGAETESGAEAEREPEPKRDPEAEPASRHQPV
jgi:hypothetical protein